MMHELLQFAEHHQWMALIGLLVLSATIIGFRPINITVNKNP